MYPDDVLLKNIQINFCYNMDLKKLWKILFPDVKMQHISIISVVSKDHLKNIFKSEYVSWWCPLKEYWNKILLQYGFKEIMKGFFPRRKNETHSIISAVSKDHSKNNFKSKYVSSSILL